MKEVYTLFLQSAQKISGDNYFATYNVNWYTFLPQKYNKFVVKTFFKTNPYADGTNLTPTVPNAVINCNLPCPNAFGSIQQGRCSTLSIAHTHFFNADYLDLNPQYYYLETPDNLSEVTVTYPQNNYLTVQLTNLTGTQLSSLIDTVNYTLILYFYPVE